MTPEPSAINALPKWPRALLAADRAFKVLSKAESAFVARTLWTFLEPSRRDQVTAWMYERQTQYLPGGAFHELGLFEWERSVVTSPPFPGRGALLVGGAGGGRELRGLCELGYSVVAFEPSRHLFDGASRVAQRYPGAQVAHGSYEDLIRHVEGVSTRLSNVLTDGIDGIILGWGSLSHVLEREDRLDLLRALRVLAPDAPVLTSFNVRGSSHLASTPPGRGRRRLRGGVKGLIRRVGTPSPGIEFNHYGFVYRLEEGEIEALAEESGYVVARCDLRESPYAVLVPAASRPVADRET